jgi:hypothetical protein
LARAANFGKKKPRITNIYRLAKKRRPREKFQQMSPQQLVGSVAARSLNVPF